jgi:hypothetical protein
MTDAGDRYSSLERGGQVDELVAGQDLASVLAVSELEIQTAIEALNRSTATISKQNETLRQQQDALARLVKANAKGHEARSELELKRVKKRDTDRKRVTASVCSHSCTRLHRD